MQVFFQIHKKQSGFIVVIKIITIFATDLGSGPFVKDKIEALCFTCYRKPENFSIASQESVIVRAYGVD